MTAGTPACAWAHPCYLLLGHVALGRCSWQAHRGCLAGCVDSNCVSRVLLLPSDTCIRCRFVLGEGIEKKTNDLAKEVEAQTRAFEEAAAKKAAAPDSAEAAPESAAEPAQV